MGRPQKRKGYRVENEIVRALKEEGIDAKRVPLSGAQEGYKGDVEIKIWDYLTLDTEEWRNTRAEVKARKDGQGFAVIERWLNGNDYLFLKRDRQKPLVVMSFEEFVRLIK